MDMVGGCCVCLDERGWDENPLVYCDGHGCNVAVHQACYGIVKVPKGPWFCCKCQSTERVARVKCELCPFKEGALKRTDNGGWAHVVCALYIPEVRFGNVSTMEPILISSVQHERFLKTCYICEENGRESKTSSGACMACNKAGCKQNFHVTCAQSKRMLCEEAGNFGNVQYVGYCSQHWSKKQSGQKGNAHVESETKKVKEKKQRVRQDSVSSCDGASNKQKHKKQGGCSKSAPNCDTIVSCSSQPSSNKQHQSNLKQELQITNSFLSKAGTAEQSAVESLNLLQQMPSLLDYFPANVNAKTPLNTVISPSPSQFSVTNLISKKTNVNKPLEQVEEIVDVESNRASPVSLLSHEKQTLQKSSEKNKSSTPSTKSQNAPAKNQADTKKSNLSLGKASLAGSKHGVPETKKRKYSGFDQDKFGKKPKNEEKKKLQLKKREKQSHPYLPKPSKLQLFEDGKIPSLYPSKDGDSNVDSFKDLLESQWDQGAQFLMQQATHFNVGTLLSCLHQLRSENEDLENRLSQLSARRDRLVAATSRLSKPFDVSLELNRPQPISSMLAKLNSEPQGDKQTSKERKANASKGKGIGANFQDNVSRNSSTPKRKIESGPKSHDSDPQPEVEQNSDSSLDGLSCKEVFCESNSLNSSPVDHNKNKTTKKEKRKKKISTENTEISKSFIENDKDTEKQTQLQRSLVQPPLYNPSEANQKLNDAGDSVNPVEFIHRIVRQDQIESRNMTSPGRPDPAEIINFLSSQSGLINSHRHGLNNGYSNRSPENRAPSTCNPVTTLQ